MGTPQPEHWGLGGYGAVDFKGPALFKYVSSSVLA